MPKEEWGVKRICPTTGKRFYDLNKNPAVSPYTGEAIEVETGKRSTIAADAEDAASKKAKEGEEELELDSLDDTADAEIEDDVLDDDDDDDNVSLDEIADVAADDDE